MGRGISDRDRCAAVNAQCGPFEAQMILERHQIPQVRLDRDVINVPRRQPGVPPIEADDGAFLGHRFVLSDETWEVPLVFEVRETRTGERIEER